MKPILVPLFIGIAFGILDVMPMKIKKIDGYSILSAFTYHVIMPFVLLNSFPGTPLILRGSILYLVCAVPLYTLVMKEDRKSVPIMAVTSTILGGLCGLLFQFIF